MRATSGGQSGPCECVTKPIPCLCSQPGTQTCIPALSKQTKVLVLFSKKNIPSFAPLFRNYRRPVIRRHADGFIDQRAGDEPACADQVNHTLRRRNLDDEPRPPNPVAAIEPPISRSRTVPGRSGITPNATAGIRSIVTSNFDRPWAQTAQSLRTPMAARLPRDDPSAPYSLVAAGAYIGA